MPTPTNDEVPPLLDTDGEEEHEGGTSKKKNKKPKKNSGASGESAGAEGGLGDDDALLALMDEVTQDQDSETHSSDEGDEEFEEQVPSEGSTCEEEEDQDEGWKDDEVSIISSDALERRYVLDTESFTHLKDPGLHDGYKGCHQDPDTPAVEEKVCGGLAGARNDYKKNCQELGIVPCPKFMREMHSAVMDLSYMGLNQKGVAAICAALEKNRHVTTLILRGNDCGGDAGEALAELMDSNLYITHLDLARTNIIGSLEGLCEALKGNMMLGVLDISRNDLTDKEMGFVSELLQDSDDDDETGSRICLRELYLSRNYIQDEGLRHLTEGIELNATLEILDLSYNRLWGAKESLPFFSALAQHETLRRLDLQGNSIKDSAGKAIAKIMTGKNSQLEYLNVSFNLLSGATCADFGKCFAASKTTNTLIAGPNRWNVGPLTQGYLANMLTPLTKAKAPAAELLDLSVITPIHSQFMKPLETLKKKRPGITVIHGQPFGFNDGVRPNMDALIIRRAKVVCEDFETPLAMLIDELRTEPPTLTTKKFKKFIKSCNLYKDKKMTKEFMEQFKAPGGLDVDCKRIIAAYDKEFPANKSKATEEFGEDNVEFRGSSTSAKNMEQLLKW